MTYETISIEKRDGVAVLTLNRPERKNAINDVMAYEWTEAVAALNEDPDVRSMVFTGAGDAFCAGADFARFEDAVAAKDAGVKSDGTGVPGAAPQRRDWIGLVRSSKPIVCAVNGACIGAGLTRILPCDVRIASTAAKFSMRFVKIGIVPEIASTQILAQIVGLQHAADLMLSARTIDGHRAKEIGLVLDVVAPDDLLPTALALASEYADNGPEAMVETKKLLYANHVEQDIRKVVLAEGAALERRWGTPENREAIAAFREKRAPDFRSVS